MSSLCKHHRCAYTNLVVIAYHKPRLHGIVFAPMPQFCTGCHYTKQHEIKPRTRENHATKRNDKY